MSILTHTMKTAKKDYLGENAKIFFPFNEGSGSVFTNIVDGMTITGLSPTHAVPHAATFYTGTSASAPTSGSLPSVPAGKSVIVFVVNIIDISSSQNVVQIGNTASGTGFGMTASFVINKSGTGSISAAFSATDTSGQSRLRGGTWNGVTGELRSYSGINAGSVAFDNTEDAFGFVGSLDLDNLIQVGSSASFIPDFYGLAMLIVDDLPEETDLLEFLDWTYQELLQGHKLIDPRLAAF